MLKKIIIISVLSLFTWQSVAYAASISTRVRILESKASKHSQTIQAVEQAQQSSAAKVDKSLAKVNALEAQLQKIMDQKKTKQRNIERDDKRYAFP